MQAITSVQHVHLENPKGEPGVTDGHYTHVSICTLDIIINIVIHVFANQNIIPFNEGKETISKIFFLFVRQF